MTAIALPTRKRKSRPARVVRSAAKTAKKGAKAWAGFKVVKFVGKGGKKLLLIPLAAGGGLLAWKRMQSSSDEPATPYGSPQGPPATPATVTPPKAAPGSAAANGEVGTSTTGATTPSSSTPPSSTS